MFDAKKEKYSYRRQYILAPRFVEHFDDWKHVQVSEDLFLSYHPDLPVTVTRHKNRRIYLLGYIIDSQNPYYDDLRIMKNVVCDSRTLDDLFVNLSDKCGRFVVIAHFEEDFCIFGDACGTRQIFYHVDMHNHVWCSSQPHIIADILGININAETNNDLKKTTLFRSPEHWYPGNITLFDNIYHLTPNHCFDLVTKKTLRYWPKERLQKLSISECLPKVSILLNNMIEGAAHRFNLAFAISCGLDSRTLLAASKTVSKDIHYITQTNQSTKETDPDVLIPTALLKRLGLKHSVLILPETLDENFREIMQTNVFTARPIKGLNAVSIYEHFRNEEKEITVLYGNCSEITKRDRFRFPKTPKLLISGLALAAMAQMSHSSVAINEFDKWLTPVKTLTKYNIDIMDLMHWEQRVGNWGAMTFSEYEMVYESFCPYSCRKYIEYMLRVPFKHRTNPKYRLHHDIIENNWPETLEYEINPENNKTKQLFLDFLYRTNLYDMIKFAYIMFYKRFK